MVWKKLKKFEDWNIALMGILIILFLLLGVYLGATYGFQAQECSNDTCLANLTIEEQKDYSIDSPNYTCKDLSCEDFLWVENYIRNNLSNITSNQIDFINVLKNANYNLQHNLNKCKAENINRYITYASLIIAIILIIWRIYELFFKKDYN